MAENNSLGCGKRFRNLGNNKQKEVLGDCDFICGVPNGWGQEILCISCDFKLREKWKEEDERRELICQKKN